MALEFDSWYKKLSQIYMPKKKLYFASEEDPELVLETFPEAPAPLADRATAAETALHVLNTDLNETYVEVYAIDSKAKFRLSNIEAMGVLRECIEGNEPMMTAVDNLTGATKNTYGAAIKEIRRCVRGQEGPFIARQRATALAGFKEAANLQQLQHAINNAVKVNRSMEPFSQPGPTGTLPEHSRKIDGECSDERSPPSVGARRRPPAPGQSSSAGPPHPHPHLGHPVALIPHLAWRMTLRALRASAPQGR